MCLLCAYVAWYLECGRWCRRHIVDMLMDMVMLPLLVLELTLVKVASFQEFGCCIWGSVDRLGPAMVGGYGYGNGCYPNAARCAFPVSLDALRPYEYM